MTAFDIIVLGVLMVSAAIGFYQGAVREMVSSVSFLAAAVAAVYGLRFSAPLLQGIIHPDWLGTACALILTFIAVFTVLRLLGASLSQSIHDMPGLGALDRSVGLGFGLLRAFIFLGACNLAFNAATPAGLRPSWLAQSKLYPLTEMAGAVLKTLAPQGMDAAGRMAPALKQTILTGSMNPKRDTESRSGYDPGSRGGTDDMVEKAR
ncbi:MAG: colicin V production protein [Phenylobacterium zucineum]|nr:MAG: colicin V production protein [Phenylobacterium zucineum]